MLQLLPHPGRRDAVPIRVEADAGRSRGGKLLLRYLLAGDLSALRIPPRAASVRSDGLWQHTCFEAFLHSGEGEAYVELNFSPSTEWAAFCFTGYRAGMAEADIPPPRIAVHASADLFELRAELRLERRGSCRIGLSAVLEEMNGAKSYWALAHPPGAPDFHHPACVALDLPPPA